jgi:hypothetical protein
MLQQLESPNFVMHSKSGQSIDILILTKSKSLSQDTFTSLKILAERPAAEHLSVLVLVLRHVRQGMLRLDVCQFVKWVGPPTHILAQPLLVR